MVIASDHDQNSDQQKTLLVLPKNPKDRSEYSKEMFIYCSLSVLLGLFCTNQFVQSCLNLGRNNSRADAFGSLTVFLRTKPGVRDVGAIFLEIRKFIKNLLTVAKSTVWTNRAFHVIFNEKRGPSDSTPIPRRN